ncbi:flagellar hook-basal body complex protein [Sedimentibacter sp. MB31-C6]|uniref:flagellar hook-basal body complex protein n=1 Tax=Sedimentibacter sp. MB31-C6 TaxID=3109366 RepID=UPI002DDD7612|nr:flagellar hook-basal body complex protein [Sedimentibacter sp. MB36-C1]WSI04988.1 flagellar hook-basal body complex protein [Sedimentibacter sp. MB36-C1]
MMKALYSGVSGMRSHQTKMDVIGNNIANVNTNGYKAQRTTFRDIYYQTMSTPTAPSDDGTIVRGGTNSSQVGYGAQVGSIDTIHTLSGYAPTNKSTDLYINGEGYFMVEDASGVPFYTRYGAFNFDSAGNMVDSNGNKVLGLNMDDVDSGVTDGEMSNVEAIVIDEYDRYKNITINADGTISAYDMDATDPDDTVVTIGQVAVAYVPNQNALVLEGNSYYSAGNNTGDITFHEPGLVGTGAIVTGGLEMSNVDLANEFSDMIVTQRGFQANTKIISVVDQMLEELVNLKR